MSESTASVSHPEVVDISAVESTAEATANNSAANIVTDSDTDSDSDSDAEETAKPVVYAPPPSINDAEAFPALGSAGSSFTAPSTNWGPSMTTPATSVPSASTKMNVSIKSSTVQDVFSISHKVSLNVVKAELAKIFNDLKKTYDVTISSTLSTKTNDRSFVVTGKPANVAKVKRELVRRLTKPTQAQFQIPAIARSAVIGAGGRTLKSIISDTGVKIDIERFQTPDDGSVEDDATINVTIDGDVDGVSSAKEAILKVVKEETKNSSIKLPIPARLVKFINVDQSSDDLNVVTKGQTISISGLRELVMAKKTEIAAQLESLDKKIITKSFGIPPSKRSLINPTEVFEKTNVLVQLPSSSTSAEQTSFTGLDANISEAIKFVQDNEKSKSILQLDVSKAHGGNIEHNRLLTLYFEQVGAWNGVVEGASIFSPSFNQAAEKITYDIVVNKDDQTSYAKAKKYVVDLFRSVTPASTKVINDITPLFADKVVSTTAAAAKAANITVVPLFSSTNGASSDILLVAEKLQDEDFEPTVEEFEARFSQVESALEAIRASQNDLKTVVVQIDAEKQQFIEGPNGTTLKSLLNVARNDILSIKLHFNGEKEASNKVFIQGSKNAVNAAQKEIESLLQDAENVKDIYSFESTIKVPTTVLSRLIGKNGANLNQLREKFEVQFDVEKNPTGEKAEIKITGYKFNVKDAEQYIQSSSKRWADETSATIIIPKKYRASFIGANGSNIKKLQAKYDVRINFSSSTDEVQIRGPSKDVAKTEKEFKDLLDYEIENGYTKELQIPEAAVSRVIGRQGEAIDRIHLASTADIKVSSDKTSDVRIITLTGSRKALTEAEKLIMDIVKDVQNTITEELEVDPKYFKDILGPKGSKKQEIIEAAGGADSPDYRRLLQIPDQGSESKTIVSTGSKSVVAAIIKQVKDLVAEKEAQVSETLDIAKAKHRLIIGPFGSVRREIEDEFKVSVAIPKADSNSTKVTITGLPESVEKAKAKIEGLIADNFKVSIDVPSNLHSAVSERGTFFRRASAEFDVQIEHGEKSGRATKLNNKTSSVPKEAFGGDDEKIKITFVDAPVEESDEVIPWRLNGSDEDVANVAAIIKDSIAKYSKHDTLGYLWVNNNKVFGRVVGPQGSRLNSIRAQSGAQIYIPRNSDKVNNVISLKGTKEVLLEAEKLIRAEIE